MKSYRAKSIFASTVIAALIIARATLTHAETREEIQSRIDAHNAAIEQLKNEIAQYEKQLTDTATKKQTLQNTLSQLDITRKKITASINVTKNRISARQLEIQELSRDIAGKERSIEIGKDGLAESLRLLNEAEHQTLVEAILSSKTIGALWNDMDANRQLQAALNRNIADLSVQKESLAAAKEETEKKKTELVAEQKTLVAQQGALDAARKTQSELLAQTKAQESAYQSILSQKKAQQASLEAALSDLKEQYNRSVTPSQVTPAGKGILFWPVDNPTITQYFGNTKFAQAGAYNGKGHNGIDLRASIGTPVKAALTGIVAGTGNTDAVRGCYSYGKWILIRHNNGLATLYAHLSQIQVDVGEAVATGQLIGYSGETGYATGPHLHFGVYVGSAVQIVELGKATNTKTPCASAIMPISPLSGYLNPLNYL